MGKLFLTSMSGKVGGGSAGDDSVEAQEYGIPLTANKTTKSFTPNAMINLRAVPALIGKERWEQEDIERNW